ncbi:uncharacterized protein N7484_007192 [Penicillium longicatenatum]|uniref:uncharacterized protein n=1 Tax=Penicillium longicatenatum TaxID=1561947 RepID=UPI0025468BEC|nr:uncharacterized protein N7484_007192 [Penicillium longicatenatum]KAJ5639330.1 hypothetical protein N7484_007192 [Penicillium longicatenatum]
MSARQDQNVLLDTKSSILIEKILEFLYTGSYILEDNTTKVNSSQSDSDKELESNNVIDSQTDENAMEDIPDEIYDINETALLSSDGTTADSMHEPPKNETRPLTGEASTTDIIELEPIVDPLTDCHPCYFHLRMYAEADYFMIEDLKTRAEENFCASFIDCAETEFLAQVITELYSTRANYLDLRVLAMKLIVDNLRVLQEKSAPTINSSLLKANPDFAVDLCMATMKKYLSESSGTNQPVFTAKYKYEYKPFQYGQWKT